jgi:hypothetical protein
MASQSLQHFESNALNLPLVAGSNGRTVPFAAGAQDESQAVFPSADTADPEVTTNKLMKGILVAILLEASVALSFFGTWQLWRHLR